MWIPQIKLIPGVSRKYGIRAYENELGFTHDGGSAYIRSDAERLARSLADSLNDSLAEWTDVEYNPNL